MNEEEKSAKKPSLPEEWQTLIAGFFPSTKYFDSRFDLLQVQIDELRRNQEGFKEQLQDVKKDMDQRFVQVDRRFEQVDKRFEQVDKRFEQVDKRFEQVDKRFEQVDKQFEQVDKRFEQMDQRFQHLEDKIDRLIERIDSKIDSGLQENRNVTIRLFTFAITFSAISVAGLFGRLLGLF